MKLIEDLKIKEHAREYAKLVKYFSAGVAACILVFLIYSGEFVTLSIIAAILAIINILPQLLGYRKNIYSNFWRYVEHKIYKSLKKR